MEVVAGKRGVLAGGGLRVVQPRVTKEQPTVVAPLMPGGTPSQAVPEAGSQLALARLSGDVTEGVAGGPTTLEEAVARLPEQEQRGWVRHDSRDHFSVQYCDTCDAADPVAGALRHGRMVVLSTRLELAQRRLWPGGHPHWGSGARLTEATRELDDLLHRVDWGGLVVHASEADHFNDEECSQCEEAGYPLERRLEAAHAVATVLAVRRFGWLPSEGVGAAPVARRPPLARAGLRPTAREQFLLPLWGAGGAAVKAAAAGPRLTGP